MLIQIAQPGFWLNSSSCFVAVSISFYPIVKYLIAISIFLCILPFPTTLGQIICDDITDSEFPWIQDLPSVSQKGWCKRGISTYLSWKGTGQVWTSGPSALLLQGIQYALALPKFPGLKSSQDLWRNQWPMQSAQDFKNIVFLRHIVLDNGKLMPNQHTVATTLWRKWASFSTELAWTGNSECT